jgi:hypothetical protein
MNYAVHSIMYGYYFFQVCARARVFVCACVRVRVRVRACVHSMLFGCASLPDHGREGRVDLRSFHHDHPTRPGTYL